MNPVEFIMYSLVGIILTSVGLFAGYRFKPQLENRLRLPYYRRQSKFDVDDIKTRIVIAALIIIGNLILVGVYMGTSYGVKLMDTEILNGFVTSKEQEKVSCSHSYDCNCRTETSCTGTGKDRTCTSRRVCDTCYEHSHDFDWNVHSTVGKFTIDRVDRQGVYTPPRWAEVKKDDPASKTHMFSNYVKAAEKSLINKKNPELQAQFAGQYPGYPGAIYDYYKIDRVLSVGVPLPDQRQWNTDVSNMLRVLGAAKQANVIIVFSNNKNPNYANALFAEWVGGKKNDIIVVIGTPEYPKIEWAAVNSWTTNQIFNVTLRDEIVNTESVDRDKIMKIIDDNIKTSFVRQSFKEYESLANEIEMSQNEIIALIAIQMFISIGLFFFMRHNY